MAQINPVAKPEERMDALPSPGTIKVHSKKTSLIISGTIALGVAIFVALIFAAVLVVIHANESSTLTTRRDAFTADCRQQNSRNTNTIRFFEGYVTKYEKNHHLTLTERRQLRSSVQVDVTLINDLAPHQNCVKLAHQLYPNLHPTGLWALFS